MDRYRTLNQLANGFNAANRLNNLRSMTLQRDGDAAIKPSSYYIFNEILKILSDYSPLPQKRMLDEVINKGNLYGTTFSNLKRHINTRERKQIDLDNIAQIITIIAPLLSNDKSMLANKLVMMYELFKS